jgi:hypothetical protein
MTPAWRAMAGWGMATCDLAAGMDGELGGFWWRRFRPAFGEGVIRQLPPAHPAVLERVFLARRISRRESERGRLAMLLRPEAVDASGPAM